jgi:hypothetical protein
MSLDNAKTVQSFFNSLLSLDQITYDDIIWLQHLGGISGIIEHYYTALAKLYYSDNGSC